MRKSILYLIFACVFVSSVLFFVTTYRKSINQVNAPVMVFCGFEDMGNGEYYTRYSSAPYQKKVFSNTGYVKGSFTVSFDIKFILYNNLNGCYPRVVYTDGTSFSFGSFIPNVTDYTFYSYTTDIKKMVSYIDFTYYSGYAQTYIKNFVIISNIRGSGETRSLVGLLQFCSTAPQLSNNWQSFRYVEQYLDFHIPTVLSWAKPLIMPFLSVFSFLDNITVTFLNILSYIHKFVIYCFVY